MTEAGSALRVLLVEDDFDVAEGLAAFLEPHGVAIDFAYSVAEARRALRSGTFDVILLDIELPDGNGISLCHEMGDEGAAAVPVIFLTARAGLDDRLAGFSAGGMDYVVKPFAPEELLARIHAMTRRVAPAHLSGEIVAGAYRFDRDTGVLHRGGRHVVLHKAARTIVGLLMEAWPGTVSRDRIESELWGDDVPDSDPLRMRIYSLRNSLREAFGDSPIAAVRNMGYRFDAANPAEGPNDNG